MTAPKEDLLRALQVMVVDDDATFRRYLEVQLDMLGCRIVPMDSGEAAWHQIQVQPPDLVLTDVFMPGMSGMDLCRKIKGTPGLEALPVVLLTMAGPRAKDDGYRAGADDFLNKPPHLLELKTRLHNLLLLRSCQRTQPLAGHAAPPQRPPTVLMVESYGILRGFVHDVLVEEGYRFLAESSVEAFLAALEAERPDLVIVDQDLMEGLGSGVVSLLRHQTATSGLPVLLMCDASAFETGAAAWSFAADEHLVKPFEATELKSRVRTLLKRAQLHPIGDGALPPGYTPPLTDPRSGAFSLPFLHAALELLLDCPGVPLMSLLAFQLSGSCPPEEVAAALRPHFTPHEALCRAAEDVFVVLQPGAEPFQLASRTLTLSSLRGVGRIASVHGQGEPATVLLKRLWTQLQREGMP